MLGLEPTGVVLCEVGDQVPAVGGGRVVRVAERGLVGAVRVRLEALGGTAAVSAGWVALGVRHRFVFFGFVVCWVGDRACGGLAAFAANGGHAVLGETFQQL